MFLKFSKSFSGPGHWDQCTGYVGLSHVGAGGEMGAMRGIMRTKIQRLVLLGVLVGGLLVALSAPASAATNQISGVAVGCTRQVPAQPLRPGMRTSLTSLR